MSIDKMNVTYRITMECPSGAGVFDIRYECEPQDLAGNVKWTLEHFTAACEYGTNQENHRHTLVKVEELPRWDAQRKRREIENQMHRIEVEIHGIQRIMDRLVDGHVYFREPLESAIASLRVAIARMQTARDKILTEPRIIESIQM